MREKKISEQQSDTVKQKVEHKSVMVAEVLAHLALKPGGIYLDVTFGGGGHTRAILESCADCTVVAMDWDARSLEENVEPLIEKFGDRIIPLWGSFAHLYKILKEKDFGQFDGILADFGTSQEQIFEGEGFSVYRDTPLDMRMSPAHQRITAEHVVNRSSALKLQEIFSQLGGERYSRTIAERIVEDRLTTPITTTKQLAKLIEKIVGFGKQRIHPATRVFQALRIFVNHELENIESFLPSALHALKPGGRLVCISFHSLEDRIVKQFFKEHAARGDITLVTKRVVKASDEEVDANRSSRSACLRAAERV